MSKLSKHTLKVNYIFSFKHIKTTNRRKSRSISWGRRRQKAIQWDISMNSRSRSRSSDMSVDKPTKFDDNQQSHLNQIEESKSENSQESMIFSKSDDSKNIKIINIDSDESEQSNFSQNSQEETKDVNENLDDSESPKPNAKVTQKEIRNIILFYFTSRVSEKELFDKDIRLSSSTVYRQYAQLRSEKGTNNKKKGAGMKKEVNQDIISFLEKHIIKGEFSSNSRDY